MAFTFLCSSAQCRDKDLICAAVLNGAVRRGVCFAMALSFLKDRDENAALGNLGAFSQAGNTGSSAQVTVQEWKRRV